MPIHKVSALHEMQSLAFQLQYIGTFPLVADREVAAHFYIIFCLGRRRSFMPVDMTFFTW
jgi:hypothetical protein